MVMLLSWTTYRHILPDEILLKIKEMSRRIRRNDPFTPQEKALVITHNAITYWHETVHLDMFFFLQCHEKLLT